MCDALKVYVGTLDLPVFNGFSCHADVIMSAEQDNLADLSFLFQRNKNTPIQLYVERYTHLPPGTSPERQRAEVIEGEWLTGVKKPFPNVTHAMLIDPAGTGTDRRIKGFLFVFEKGGYPGFDEEDESESQSGWVKCTSTAELDSLGEIAQKLIRMTNGLMESERDFFVGETSPTYVGGDSELQEIGVIAGTNIIVSSTAEGGCMMVGLKRFVVNNLDLPSEIEANIASVAEEIVRQHGFHQAADM